MAKYTGPVCRLCRQHGDKLMLKGERCFTPRCAMERRGTVRPGGQLARRRRLSGHAVQLREKQKLRRIYGVLERQFRRYFAEAKRRPGITGENLLQLLELRLDNVVYRLGFASSRAEARQLVCHGHIILAGRKTDIPSCLAKPGDVVSWMPRSKALAPYQAAAEMVKDRPVPPWLELNQATMTGRILALPSRGDIGLRVDEQAVVEYYSR